MQNIEQFAYKTGNTHAPQMSDGRWTHNNNIAPEIIEFLEDECDLREFFVSKPMNNVLSKTYRIEREEGMAVQIAGNAEVPRAESISKLFTVFLHRNATGYKIDDDDRKINSDNPNFEAKKMENALKRMLRKEIYDMMAVFKASAAGTITYPSTGITVAAIKDAVTTMVATNQYDFIEPNVIFMSYVNFRTLQADPKFRYVPELFQRILIEGKISPGSVGPTHGYSGRTGQFVDGLEIYICNEIGTDVILLDSTQEALWLNEDQSPTITAYRDDEHISDIVDIRHDEQPVCVKPWCLYKMTKATS